MSQTGIEALATKVVTDPDFGTALQDAIESAESPAAEVVVAFGAQAGFTFTVEEAAAMGSALRNRPGVMPTPTPRPTRFIGW